MSSNKALKMKLILATLIIVIILSTQRPRIDAPRMSVCLEGLIFRQALVDSIEGYIWSLSDGDPIETNDIASSFPGSTLFGMSSAIL